MFPLCMEFVVALMSNSDYGPDLKRPPRWLRRLVAVTYPLAIVLLFILFIVFLILSSLEYFVIMMIKIAQGLWHE